MTAILAPVAGTVVPLADVPDPVFAAGMVGPGLAIDPLDTATCTAFAPISGRLTKTFPHAFVVQHGELGVLVHLGIDTITLNGEGFRLLAEEGSEITAGSPLIEWSPAAVVALGLSPLVLVCVPGVAAEALDPGAPGRSVEAGGLLFPVPIG